MGMLQSLRFDLLIPKVRVQNEKMPIDVLAAGMAPVCGIDLSVLSDLMRDEISQMPCGIGQGVAVLDVRSAKVRRPGIGMAVLNQGISLEGADDVPVDVLAVVLSPFSDGPLHLQRVAAVTRLLRNEELCDALRDAPDVDTMRILLMPSQRWMRAA
ncbi:MAG: PTS sugar transporter subunit IIA [Alphaproteobacteria bacterium]|nr:PTS sugar transporter subunit IIA [Alphaproteobacteria bacterium]